MKKNLNAAAVAFSVMSAAGFVAGIVSLFSESTEPDKNLNTVSFFGIGFICAIAVALLYRLRQKTK